MKNYLPEYITTAIGTERQWLEDIVMLRFNVPDASEKANELIQTPPQLCDSPYLELIHQYQLSPEERLVLILALTPHIAPGSLDFLTAKDPATGRTRTEFGGKISSGSKYFLPTADTALMIIAGSDILRRIRLLPLFDQLSKLSANNIVDTAQAAQGDPPLSGVLEVSREVLDFITSGVAKLPRFGEDFPARLYTTALDWKDMVFSKGTNAMLEDVKSWLKHHRTLLDEMGYGRRLGKGYKALFHGPPGNGKSVTAALLGKFIGKDVLRIDLSMVVSKYIGETEKNLKKVFDRAERSEAILFFDEADSLFGKRTATKDAHDRYSNQEINYLLQRIEEFYGIVFLATNFRNNIDDAFTRRFNTMVYFPMPDAGDRLQMWKKAFTENTSFGQDVRLTDFADKYAISCAQIANVGAWCTLMAIERNNFTIDHATLRAGLSRELGKEGRTL